MDRSNADAAGPTRSRRRAIRSLATILAGRRSCRSSTRTANRCRTSGPGRRRSADGTAGWPASSATPARSGPGVIRPPGYRDEIMKVINLHEFEDAAKKSLSVAAYDYVAAGAGDELTLKANREAFSHYWVRAR